jgi:tetratricopeptide (TPR) repeat protein
MIYDADNQPCPGVQMEIDGRDGPLTDIRGRFVIPDLARGDHRIVARKAGFEELVAGISFVSKADVLHLQMTSFSQLLGMAHAALSEMLWAEAESFLQRAEKLDPADAVLRYLLAVHAYKTGNYASAVTYLKAINEAGQPEAAVHLFLADIYEKNLDDPQGAIDNLEAYLRLRDDPEMRRRLENLKAGQKEAEQQAAPP